MLQLNASSMFSAWFECLSQVTKVYNPVQKLRTQKRTFYSFRHSKLNRLCWMPLTFPGRPPHLLLDFFECSDSKILFLFCQHLAQFLEQSGYFINIYQTEMKLSIQFYNGLHRLFPCLYRYMCYTQKMVSFMNMYEK